MSGEEDWKHRYSVSRSSQLRKGMLRVSKGGAVRKNLEVLYRGYVSTFQGELWKSASLAGVELCEEHEEGVPLTSTLRLPGIPTGK